MVEFWHGTSPKMIAQTANLLLKFPEAAFDPETAAVRLFIPSVLGIATPFLIA